MDASGSYDQAENQRRSTGHHGSHAECSHSDHHLHLYDKRTFLAYDSRNRLTSKVTPEETTTYAYDASSRLTSATDGDVSLSYSYDAGNSWCRWTAHYAYDALGPPLAD